MIYLKNWTENYILTEPETYSYFVREELLSR